jgi:1-acyl-sn-glycerol-3-phosphate acyltransferase
MNISKFILNKILDWKIVGDFKEKELKKVVIIVVPHTSWHDFYIAILCRKTLGLMINFIGKKELFIWPFGYYFKWLGGAPLDRASNQNKVEAIASIFNTKDEFRLGMSPEGTRKKTKKWRTGFYYIALEAKVPIIPASMDYKTKTVTIGKPLHPTGAIESDIKILKEFFKGSIGKIAKYT